MIDDLPPMSKLLREEQIRAIALALSIQLYGQSTSQGSPRAVCSRANYFVAYIESGKVPR